MGLHAGVVIALWWLVLVLECCPIGFSPFCCGYQGVVSCSALVGGGLLVSLEMWNFMRWMGSGLVAVMSQLVCFQRVLCCQSVSNV